MLASVDREADIDFHFRFFSMRLEGEMTGAGTSDETAAKQNFGGHGIMRVVRVGVVGSDNTHAFPLCAFLNGWSEGVPVPVRLPDGRAVPNFSLWGSLLRRLEAGGSAGVPVGGARVSAVWSADRREAELLAGACGIDRVCESPEQACVDVDAVMVLSEDPGTHLGYARPALEQGLPTFIDKPLAESVGVGREICRLAERHGARWFTGSALRWSPELDTVRGEVGRLGGVRAVHIQIPGEVELYGIHAVEVANLFLGCDVVSVRAMSGPGRQVVLLEYRDGRSAVFENLSFLRWPVYTVGLYGDTWHRGVELEPPSSLLALVQKFVDFARGAPTPVAPEESIRLLEIATTATQALKENKVLLPN